MPNDYPIPQQEHDRGGRNDPVLARDETRTRYDRSTMRETLWMALLLGVAFADVILVLYVLPLLGR